MTNGPVEPHAGKDATPVGPAAAAGRRSTAGAVLVGAGILLSRVAGLARERVLASYFGAGLHGDVFGFGLRLPNVLQNLLGEGTLSASFIPVYSELLGQGRTKEAGRVAGAAFALLLAVAGGFSLVGLTLAPVIVSVFTPGFEGHRRELMIAVVRILFPMTGVLVLSAWALGILNSHRKFFVPYVAPVLWNGAIIAALVGFGSRLDLDGLLMAAAWGALLGGVLQLAIQLPWVLKLERELKLNSGRGDAAFGEAVRNALPAIAGRGVVQISAYIDTVLASLLAIGGPTRLRCAQTLYMLPISLFGMSVAAAELPELSRARGAPTTEVRERTVAALRRVAFFVVPSCVAFVGIGDVLVAGLYRTGKFGAADVTVAWVTLAGYSLGMLASTATRVYQSAFFALRDTRTPARVATLRVLTSAVAGGVLMVQLEPVTLLGMTIPAGVLAGANVAGVPLGPLGLAIGAAVGAWLEWILLRARLRARIGTVGAGAGPLLRMFGAALLAAAAGRGARLALGGVAPLPAALVVAAVFGLVYLGAARTLGLGEADLLVAALRRRLGRAKRPSAEGS